MCICVYLVTGFTSFWLCVSITICMCVYVTCLCECDLCVCVVSLYSCATVTIPWFMCFLHLFASMHQHVAFCLLLLLSFCVHVCFDFLWLVALILCTYVCMPFMFVSWFLLHWHAFVFHVTHTEIFKKMDSYVCVVCISPVSLPSHWFIKFLALCVLYVCMHACMYVCVCVCLWCC